jgi:hypothetical protein
LFFFGGAFGQNPMMPYFSIHSITWYIPESHTHFLHFGLFMSILHGTRNHILSFPNP